MSNKKRTMKKSYLNIAALLILLVIVVVGATLFFTNSGENENSVENHIENTSSIEASDDFIDKSESENSHEVSENDSELDEEKETAASQDTEEQNDMGKRVNTLISEMTLEDKIYQMFIITPEQLTGVPQVTAAGETTKSKLEQYPVGGLIYFSTNLISREQTVSMLSNVQSYSYEVEGIPLFLCVDEEGGRITRIASNSAFGVAQVGPMADVKDEEEAYQCGEIIGAYLSDLGFNVDFAPDADVLTNDSNSVIGDRSFGADADVVSKYSVAYSNGLHSQGILSTFKHFPGHGATEADTHEGYAYINKTYEELFQADLKPFMAAQDYEVDFVMVAHISIPNVIGDDTPCSLSKKAVTDILRNDLGYEELIITDALNMGAITERNDSSGSAVEAVKAGVDLLLMPDDLNAAYSGIYNAVKNQEITEERIDESLRRILKAKIKMMDEE